MDVGDNIEVMVQSRRGKQTEWVPAVVSFITDQGAIEVMFDGGSKQRFAPGSDRLRMAGNASEEGMKWEF